MYPKVSESCDARSIKNVRFYYKLEFLGVGYKERFVILLGHFVWIKDWCNYKFVDLFIVPVYIEFVLPAKRRVNRTCEQNEMNEKLKVIEILQNKKISSIRLILLITTNLV